MANENLVYSRIRMALISAQRVEFITGELLNHLIEFDSELYGITTSTFFDKTKKAQNTRKTLGQILHLLKLNPKLVIEADLDEYVNRRNLLAHSFWKEYLNRKTAKQAEKAVEFCNEFGKLSVKLESFF